MTLPLGLLHVGRRSSLLFHWRAADGDTAITGQAGTTSRTSAGSARDKTGRYYIVPAGTPVYGAVDADGDGVPESRALLLRPQRTNKASYSDTQGTLGALPSGFSGASGSNTVVVSNDIADVTGNGLTAKHTRLDASLNNSGFRNSLTSYPNNTVIVASCSVYIPSDSTAALVWMRLEGTGITVGNQASADMSKRDQWQRLVSVGSNASGGAIGGAGVLRIDAVPGATAYCYSDAWQIEAQAQDAFNPGEGVASEWILTGGSEATYNSESMKWPISFKPQECTLYVKWMPSPRNAIYINRNYVHIGSGTGSSGFRLARGWGYDMQAAIMPAAPATAALGTSVGVHEALAQYCSDGIARMQVDGVAAMATSPAATAMPASFGENYIAVVGDDDAAWLEIKVAQGRRDWTYMRNAW